MVENVTCRRCRFRNEDVILTANGTYYFAWCGFDVVHWRVVDLDALRECGDFREAEEPVDSPEAAGSAFAPAYQEERYPDDRHGEEPGRRGQ